MKLLYFYAYVTVTKNACKNSNCLFFQHIAFAKLPLQSLFHYDRIVKWYNR